MKIALVTSSLGGPYVDSDLPFLVDGLTASGFLPAVAVWNDRDVNWSAFDLVLIRSPWDYTADPPAFLDWLDRVAAVTHVLNAPGLIRWNIDKVYLRDLDAAAADLPIVPTEFCTTMDAVRQAVSAHEAGRVVIKPSVSAGSQDTGLFEPGDGGALALAEHILAIGKTVMVQPAIASVQERGERALLFFDGRFSHAVSKGPLLAVGGGLRGGSYVEDIASVTATPAERAVGERLIAVTREILLARGLSAFDALPLYARIDVVDDGEAEPLVLEAELFEPSLFIDSDPDAVGRFVDAVSRRAGDLGRR